MRFIKNGILLLLISTVFYFGIFYVLNITKINDKSLIHSLNTDLVWEGGNSYERFRDFDRNKQYDMLVMGSSHAYRGFDPRIFRENGIEMFNLGSSSQSIIDTEILLRNLVDIDRVHTIIFEVFPLTFVEDGYESTAFLVANIPQDEITMKLLKNRCDLKALNMWTQRTMRKLDDGPQYTTEDYVENGYCENTDSNITVTKFLESTEFSVKEESVAALESIIKYVKENDINAVFVTQPMPIETDRLMFDEFSEFMKHYVSNDHIVYLDYSQMTLDSKNHFFDYSHLNQAGVALFNAKLLEELKKRNLLFND